MDLTNSACSSANASRSSLPRSSETFRGTGLLTCGGLVSGTGANCSRVGHIHSVSMGTITLFSEATGELAESELLLVVELEGEMARAEGEAAFLCSFGGDRCRDTVDILRNSMRFSGWSLIKEG
jgi:hypothetical protein